MRIGDRLDTAASGRTRPPAPRPCESCPYRTDVPSAIWAAEEYEKLRSYDRETGAQPMNMFQCHQADAGSTQSRICAGWAGCHGEELLALRIAVSNGRISTETYEAAARYSSPVELFGTGDAAARHGQSEIDRPSRAAQTLAAKIARNRADLEGLERC